MHEREPVEYERLYDTAFEEFGARALWNVRRFSRPSPRQALTITPALRTYGGMGGRRLAERIERLCRDTAESEGM